MLTVVGLGNPGAAYDKTRHNVGFMLIDRILENRIISNMSFPPRGLDFSRRFFASRAKFKKTSRLFLSIRGEIEGKSFYMVKPTTFMNESGKALTSLKTRGIFKDLSEVLVIVDDVDLVAGRIRLRPGGSAGGHNGLKSIINHLGTDEFARLRIGIGPRPNGDEIVEYVLGTFKPEEKKIINTTLEKAAHVVGAFITGGYENALTVFSGL